jgi:alpha-L-fucosidase
LVQEDIRFGQRVKEFTLEAYAENDWELIASQTTIGRKRILRFPNVVASKLRLNIVDSKACPVISNIGVYNAPKVVVEPVIQRNKAGEVSIHGFDSGLDIYYSIDGTNPSKQSLKYDGPFLQNEKTMVQAIVVDPTTGKSSAVSTVQFDVSKEDWNLVGKSPSQEATRLIFDGNPETAWILKEKLPADVVVDLGGIINIKGFTYLPDQGRWDPGIINRYELYVSNDGLNWGRPVSEGEFANIKNSPILQQKEFDVTSCSFIKFKILSPAHENGRVGIAELGIITQ